MTNLSYGGSLAVFNDKIYYAYTAMSQDASGACSPYANTPSLFVATFDPQRQTWTGIRQLLYQIPQVYASGAALTVFNGQLYLFSDKGTHTTGNPEEGWVWHSGALAPGYEPLDALTIYPQNAPPRVLIAYGRQTSGSTGYYTELYSSTWNGQFGSPLDVLTRISDAGHLFNGEVSLQTGTAINQPFTVMNGTPGWANYQGAKSPSIQLMAVRLPATNIWDRGYVVHYEYNISTGTWTKDSNYFGAATAYNADLWTYPWYASRCDATKPWLQGLRQFIVVNYLTMSSASSGSSSGFAYDSDSLVPQNYNPANGDLAITTCSETGGHNNTTANIELNIAKHYWTLAGVVLGPPPFSLNGVTDEGSISDLSNVDYGEKHGTAINHTQEMGKQALLSAGLEVSAGFFGVGVSNSFDISYKHGEDSAHAVESSIATGFNQKMGTNTGFGTLVPGSIGWAIFQKPTMRVQDYAAHAYDYDVATGAGTYLNQDLTTITKAGSGTDIVPYHFNLANPSTGEIVGLMAGMRGLVPDPATGAGGFPLSTDLDSWQNVDWETNSQPWEVVAGSGALGEPSLNVLKMTAGQNAGVYLTEEKKDVRTEGVTNALGIQNTTEVGADTAFGGFKAHLTVGADWSWKTTTSDTTSFTKDVGFNLKMKLCGPDVPPGTRCVTSLEMRPFILKAKDSSAPWIPDAFRGQKPWAITWQVLSYQSYIQPAPVAASGLVAATALGPLAAPDLRIARYGQSLPPRHASGRIVGGSGGGEPGDPLSHYSLQGGRLQWVDENGVETRIPMTADTFVPADGVSLDINGHTWSSLGETGEWTRDGDVWTFTSGADVRENRVLLTLDFGQGTFNLQLAKVDFQGRIRAAVGEIPMNITVNGLYTFHTVLRHDFDVTWHLTQPPINNTRMQLTAFNGRYNKAAGSGNMTLEGTLPAVLPAFGDIALKMNDRVLLLQLLSMEGFREAFESGGSFRYVKEGLNINLDFGNKTWAVTLNNQAFQKLLALRWGGSRIALNVGGLPWYDQEHAIVDFTAKLSLEK
ncbi:MAG TPA: hypothetical protein VN428_17320 [Bryobacteraceae bacterium]|nr:hypothetical protein [Bryobacteraceae bacterium]